MLEHGSFAAKLLVGGQQTAHERLDCRDQRRAVLRRESPRSASALMAWIDAASDDGSDAGAGA